MMGYQDLPSSELRRLAKEIDSQIEDLKRQRNHVMSFVHARDHAMLDSMIKQSIMESVKIN